MTKPVAETRELIVQAEEAPLPHADAANPQQRYRLPRTRIRTRPLGSLADDHVRVEMLYAGICGTDVHLLQSDPLTGYVRTSAPALIPPEGRVMGHEGVGRVIEAGAGVHHVGVGDVVAFASIMACLRCEVCRRGAFNQCPSARLLGMQVDGLFGTVVDVPAVLAHDVSAMIGNDADLRAAACLEPAGVALLACENARVAPGESVVIFGAGPIGIYCAMLCKRVFGAAQVVMVEPLEGRRHWAREWCDAVYDVEAYFAATHRPVDVVVEGSGDLGNVGRVFRGIGPNGRVVLLGRSGMPLEIAAVDHMITQAISITGSRGHLGGPLARVIALYGAGMLPLNAVVTDVLGSLDELLGVLREADALAGSQCKVLVRMNP